jgi:hypothetical protein
MCFLWGTKWKVYYLEETQSLKGYRCLLKTLLRYALQSFLSIKREQWPAVMWLHTFPCVLHVQPISLVHSNQITSCEIKSYCDRTALIKTCVLEARRVSALHWCMPRIVLFNSCVPACTAQFRNRTHILRSRGSVVGTAAGYGLDDRRGIEVRVPTGSSRPSLGSTQPPIQLVPGVKRQGREADDSLPCRGQENVDPYIHSPHTSS